MTRDLIIPPLRHGDPGPAIREILTELVIGAVAYAAGTPRRGRRRLMRAQKALALLLIQLDQVERPRR